MKRKIAWLTATAVLLGGCATAPVYISSKYGALGKVALLPVSNMTTDLDGPPFVRKLLQEQLMARGYDLVPLETIDAKLKEQGFTDGGQLNAAKPDKLGEWLGADSLFYPVLEDFNYLNVGFYWQRRVKIAGRLVDAKSGDKLWEAEREWATREVVADRKHATERFAVQLAAKALEKMTHTPLQPESRVAVTRLLDTLPTRH